MSASAQVLLVVLAITLAVGVWAGTILIDEGQRRGAVLEAAGGERDGALATGTAKLATAFRRLRPVAALQQRLRGGGLGWSASWTIIVVLTVMVMVYVLGQSFLGRVASLLVVAALPSVAWQWLQRRVARRAETFIAQLPDLARILANGTSAGLSMRRCLGIAAREMTGPAGEEVTRISAQVETGWSVEQALEGMAERMPSRELNVLVRTIIIQSRTGGKLTTALQDIAHSLEDRKELRREVATVILGSSVSGYAVFGIGIGAVLLLNLMQPGLLDMMISQPLGQAVLVIAAVMYALGFVLMRVVSRVEV